MGSSGGRSGAGPGGGGHFGQAIIGPLDGHSVRDCGEGVLAIDSLMHGLAGVTAVYCLPGPRPAIIETGPSSSLPAVLAGLESLGIDRLDWIIVTHIHLDHAGAAGHLAQRFPEARVVVRTEGARHLVDPSRLWASAARLYDNMDQLWGPMLPIDPERIDAVSADGVVAELGDGRVLEAVYTPGHAAHHMAIWEPGGGDAFTGDALGVFLAEMGAVHPATPPPEFDLEVALDSIARLRRLGPLRVFPTHFGPLAGRLEERFDQAGDCLHQAVGRAVQVVGRGGGIAEMAAAFREDQQAGFPGLDALVAERLSHTTSHELNARGIARYLSKVRGLHVPS